MMTLYIAAKAYMKMITQPGLTPPPPPAAPVHPYLDLKLQYELISFRSKIKPVHLLECVLARISSIGIQRSRIFILVTGYVEEGFAVGLVSRTILSTVVVQTDSFLVGAIA